MGYLRSRAITYIVVWFVALNLAFIIPRLAPGNAAEILASPGKLPAASVLRLEHLFGLTKPMYVQYVLFLKNTLTTFPPNFGYSFEYYPQTVSSIIFQRLPASAFLMVVSLFLAFGMSYFLTMETSLRRGGKLEMGSLYSAIFFQAMPAFWTALVLLWIFGVDLKLFPVYGISSVSATTPLSYALSVLWHSVLPILAMTLAIFGQLYLVFRGSTLQVLKSDYVVAAMSRGLKRRTIERKYILRNSLLPVVSLVAFYFGVLVSVSILIELVFGFAGLGDLFTDAVFTRDYPVLQGGFFYMTTIIVIAGFVGDIILTRLDPRLAG